MLGKRIFRSAVGLAGTFREDLRLRLEAATIDLPPLRSRRNDIALLASHFLAESSAVGAHATAFAPDAMERLEAYAWPQNVAELRAVVERAALAETSEMVRIGSLPIEIQGQAASPPPDEAVIGEMSMGDALELIRTEGNRRYLEIVLRKFRGDVAAAAEHAGIERESFYRLLRRWGISPSAFRGRP